MDKYRIIALDNQKKSGQNNNVIPQHQFSMLMLAARGSGKTTTLLNLLMNPAFYKGYFHNVFIWSPTLRQDEKWGALLNTKGVLAQNKVVEGLMETSSKSYEQAVEGTSKELPFTGIIPTTNCYTHYDEATLQHIISYQELQIEYLQAKKRSKKDSDRVLLVFDDALGLDNSLFKRNSLFSKLNTMNRHLNISIIVVSQAYKQIPRTIRVNMSNYVVFEIANQQEIKLFYEENNNSLTFQDWYDKYRQATNEPYSFLYINYQAPKGKRLMKRFEELL